MKVYLAGPQVFTPQGERFVRERLIPSLEENGYECIYPTDLGDDSITELAGEPVSVDRAEALNEWAMGIGQRNCEAIVEADVVLANLDGADPDSGTSAEIGYAYGIGTPIVGYRTDSRTAGENEGLVVNLQVEYFIWDSGGSIVSADNYGGEWEAEHHRLYESLEDLEDLIIEELDAL
ncbi:2-deoxyribonucleoside glycosidase [Halorubrum sp. CBA1125]|jgi:nucleoside 2-deoxyribosyltransferase|uniref:nucleoside 2-deoxyribosyltransferase n=1 Tax=Halorubrum sp. CBA1125 TaxID=2668072 RepID=UPI0012E73756|nr:nucleoside 2-deoxyribosyltransferase [Halorubrum sp. CBA1125]MUW13440.1 2-deoxyribonucleoside glycosidase [Halorubrum sp. CBA1125]